MRFVFRWLFRLLVVGLVLSIGVVLLKDLLLKELLASHIERETGLETRIGRLEVGILSPRLTVENLRLYNPPEFGGSVFLHVAECHVEYDWLALLQHRVHLRLFRLNLAEASIVEDVAGQTNLESIHRRLRRKQASEPRSDFTFGGLDMLNLSLGRLHRLNLAAPGRIQTISLGVQNEIYTNLDTEKDVLYALGRLALRIGVSQLTNHFPIAPDLSRPRSTEKAPAPLRPPATTPAPGRR
ncbi:MAG TPA: hypothetical protein PLY00_08030 [Verrucomicrobiota bacterium]|nr:hypothetical protein [Verrucomicrobiota bacterium]HOR71220.1 hypothetical protein [Verrucomicrobiota bacterium]HOU87232.1 hypothetical protein [Verrucomicrobiota bacterium]HPK97337.1 hypothetical protein [Verrucomicrobiota bacterium]HQF58942.1 hypothetical protein [Verrucomicrobiota bacterium]